MIFSELNQSTRDQMLTTFELEEAGTPYRSQILSNVGLTAFPDLMREAITKGDETTLAAALDRSDFWLPYDAGGKTVNVRQRSEQLALTEFNTWYVAGLARKLKLEGETHCEVYRAANPKWEPALCTTHEGVTYPLDDIIRGHRIGYSPLRGVLGKLSIPAGPGCHHTIRRVISPLPSSD